MVFLVGLTHRQSLVNLGSNLMKSLKAFAWSICFLLSSIPAFAFDYSNSQLGFKATLPDGLDDVTKMMRVPSLISVGKLNESRSGLVKLISIQDLGGTIGREDLSKTANKPVNVSLEKASWRSFQVDVFKIVETAGGVSLVTFNAQVPLKPHAMQITVSGPVGEESGLRSEMQAVVASIEGPSNWLTTDERISRGASGLGRLIAFGCLIVIVLVVAVRKLAHRGNTG